MNLGIVPGSCYNVGTPTLARSLVRLRPTLLLALDASVFSVLVGRTLVMP